MAKVDLHMHSSYSDDGDYSPEELVSLASKKAGKIHCSGPIFPEDPVQITLM